MEGGGMLRAEGRLYYTYIGSLEQKSSHYTCEFSEVQKQPLQTY